MKSGPSTRSSVLRHKQVIASHVLNLPPELLSLLLSEWMDIQMICLFDVAMSSHLLLPIWRYALQFIKLNHSIESWEHTHASIRWLIQRKIDVTNIRIKRFSSLFFNTFHGIKMMSLKTLQAKSSEDFYGCSYDTLDNCLLQIAKGCPNLRVVNIGEYLLFTTHISEALHNYCPFLNWNTYGRSRLTRKMWHTPHDIHVRRFMADVIRRLLERRRGTSTDPVFQEKMRRDGKRIEESLYYLSYSRSEYLDLHSLKLRLRQLAERVVMKKTSGADVMVVAGGDGV